MWAIAYVGYHIFQGHTAWVKSLFSLPAGFSLLATFVAGALLVPILTLWHQAALTLVGNPFLYTVAMIAGLRLPPWIHQITQLYFQQNTPKLIQRLRSR